MSSSTRGRAGKYSKPKRGGGKKFSRNLQPLNDDGEVENMWAARDPKATDDSSEEDSDEDSSEDEDDSSDDGRPGPQGGSVQTREERKAAVKARKEAAIARQKKKVAAPGDLPTDSSEEEDDDDDDDDEDSDDAPANPNHTAKARSQAASQPKAPEEPAKATPGSSKAAAGKKTDLSQLTRREREALQAQQARERYQKLHAEGKTDEAKADLARLAVIKERRAAEAARKQAEAEEKAEREKERQEGGNRERRMREAAMGSNAAKSGKGGKKK